MAFSSLGLCAELTRALAQINYTAPTPIQTEAIPAVLAGRDVWACAHTGTGKTAAFALPLLQQRLHEERGHPVPIRALVLVPTRELAAQIRESMATYTRYLQQPIKVISVFGGVSINPQMMALRGGADIVVATPGRLLDLIEHNALSLAQVTTLVLDEADRLLDLGFADELANILRLLPRARQNLVFSATFPPAVHALAENLLHDPLRIDVTATPVAKPDIVQRAIQVEPERRAQLLRHLIEVHQWSSVLVFVATKYATEHVARKLRRVGIEAVALNGELSQGARTNALAGFKAQRFQVLVATDVAARGIDITQLQAVVNFDLPRSAADYIHRIGRTGRAGASGVALSFISQDTEAHFRLIEKRHRLRLPRETIAGFEPPESAAKVTGSELQ
ncbi:MAG: DEAD/DEAH box helicase [Pseudomonadota bacterium]|nr:DEAD/DEAH box helicase [Pseudomonadota bacterium]